MFKKYKFLALCILGFVVSCAKFKEQKDPLAYVLESQNPNIKRVMDSIGQYEVQIRYTQIHRKNDSVHFTDYNFQQNDHNYFYPASTVKLPIALLTVEKLNGIDSLHIHSRFYVEGDSVETTFAKEISKIFAVSDNAAYNRLFEFLGQDYINTTLKNKGIDPIRISHRLSVPDSEEITAKPLIIYLNDSTTAPLTGSINTSARPLELSGLLKGIGYYEDGELIEEPFDFSLKNYYPISTQHEVLKRIFFSGKYTSEQNFNSTDPQLAFIKKAMRTLPKNAGYDPEFYYDGYCKFFMYGDTKTDIPQHIKIYNKVGDAYGTLTDCAYITDTTNGVEFLLTATILVNKNGIFNDDTYAYDEIGFPFLAELGRQLYTYELNLKN